MGNVALQLEKMKTINQLLPQRGPAVYPSGIYDRDKTHVIYGPKSSDQPTLLVSNPIYDKDRNVIQPGYYELMLSYDRKNLLLTQRQELIAVIPVFKVEEDLSQEQEQQPNDWLSQKKAERKQKKEEKKKRKLAAEGKLPEEPGIYNKATIEWKNEGYYLIKYERGKIQAWGAIKM